LEQEFNTLVPTQRLWTKINDSIEQEREKQSFWTPVFAFFKQPSMAAFAGLLIVAGLFAVVLNRGTAEEPKDVAVNNPKEITNTAVSQPIEPVIQSPTVSVSNESPNYILASNSKNKRSGIRVIEAKSIKTDNRKPSGKRKNDDNIVTKPEIDETLTGEESYIKTIATLTESVKNRKDEVLKPSARFAFERDIAVADNAIKTMKKEVKQNPKNDAAKQILRASYQNKIDLLNSVADKTELMASVK